jgi:excisionase family DNA binding protein
METNPGLAPAGLGQEAVGMSGRTVPDAERLLTPAEVAAMFRVDPKTVTRWARDGRLTSVRTLGGHRRYRESEVLALLRAAHTEAAGE